MEGALQVKVEQVVVQVNLAMGVEEVETTVAVDTCTQTVLLLEIQSLLAEILSPLPVTAHSVKAEAALSCPALKKAL